ncbi:MAG: hypothetical protein C4540_03770 [Candidatus Omnitrophota bacterium]|jgi:hypothetical protein|nr:MAG: hypothetical protein C4540_03770 [Candidatus Omnitrophota bacterium]
MKRVVIEKSSAFVVHYMMWIVVSTVFIMCSQSVYAMDEALWNLPAPANTKVIWQDKPLEFNGVSAPSIRLRSQLSAEEIYNFYKEILSQRKWELSNFKDAQRNTYTFVKDGAFIYLAIFEYPEEEARDIYLVKSSANLSFCYTLKDQVLQKEVGEDLPGKDIPGVLRYPGSKRKVDFAVPGEGEFLMYEANAQPQEIAQFFRRTLKPGGWIEERQFTEESVANLPQDLKAKVAVLIFHRGNESLVINITNALEQPNLKEKFSKRSLILICKNPEQIAVTAEGGTQ